MRKLLFLIIVLYLYISTLLTSLLLICPVMINNIFSKNKNWGYTFKNILYINISFIIKYFLRTEIYINSNKLVDNLFNETNQVFLIQNHFTEIDYFFQTFLLTNLNTPHKLLNYKFLSVAKKFVGNIFLGLGIFSLLSNDIYLVRDINIDCRNISKRYDECNMIYMFPEGTCYNKFTKAKSDEYIKENKLIKYKYHLYPRLTGMFLLIKKNPNLRTVYDMTMVYDTIPKEKYGEPFRFEHFIYKYDFPNKVFINIERYPIDNSIYFQDRIEYIFIRKDNFLMNFNQYQNQFENIIYNSFIAFFCFILFNFTAILSLGMFIEFELIRVYYFIQILAYLIYFNFFY